MKPVAAAPLALAACVATPLESPPLTAECHPRVAIRERVTNKVDVLFLVDNSASMQPMSAELTARFGEFFKVFQDLAQAGTQPDLQIGVVTSDYGAGATGAPQCQPSPGGQQGRLQAVGAAAPNGCKPPTGANFIKFDFAHPELSNLPSGQDLVATFTCMASVGSSGCGFEHQLESVYAALHNQIPENAGFLREDALLAVVFLTNEDDASAPPDTDVFDKNKVGPACQGEYGYEDSYSRQTRFAVQCGSDFPPYGDSMGPLSNCHAAPNPGGAGPGKMFDIQRYIDFFTKPAQQGGVKANPSDVILFAIDAPSEPFQVILADPATQVGVTQCGQCDESGRTPCVPVLAHSCVNAQQPSFFGDPAVRLNEVVSSAANHQISSICESDYTGALKGVADLISIKLGNGCIPVADPAAADCTVEDVTQNDDGTTSVAEIPKCGGSPAFPCWSLDAKPVCASVGGYGITIQRGGALPPPHTNARAECGGACH